MWVHESGNPVTTKVISDATARKMAAEQGVSLPRVMAGLDLTAIGLFELNDAVVPGYDAETQSLAQSLDKNTGTTPHTYDRTYILSDALLAQAQLTYVDKMARARYNKEGAGIFWTDDTTAKVYYLDTTLDSQNRFASARIAIDAGNRIDGSVWKCADVTSGSPVLTFRPTTNAELTEWAGLVHDHIQKCFEAEAAAVAKVMAAADVAAVRAVDYGTEFDAL